MQYLDTVIGGRDWHKLAPVMRCAAKALDAAGFLVSPKSVLDPVQALPWMGKEIVIYSPGGGGG